MFQQSSDSGESGKEAELHEPSRNAFGAIYLEMCRKTPVNATGSILERKTNSVGARKVLRQQDIKTAGLDTRTYAKAWGKW